MFFGSFATLIGAWGTWMLRHRRWLAPVPTVLANAAIIPPVLRWGCGLELPLPLMAACIAVGEVVGWLYPWGTPGRGDAETERIQENAGG